MARVVRVGILVFDLATSCRSADAFAGCEVGHGSRPVVAWTRQTAANERQSVTFEIPTLTETSTAQGLSAEPVHSESRLCSVTSLGKCQGFVIGSEDGNFCLNSEAEQAKVNRDGGGSISVHVADAFVCKACRKTYRLLLNIAVLQAMLHPSPLVYYLSLTPPT